MKRTLLSLLVAAAVLVPLPAAAQGFVNPFLGWNFGGDATCLQIAGCEENTKGWGVAFGAVPVAWSTWLTRTVPDEAESAGGLLVAAVQLAIATGAAAGGAIFDVSGALGVFTGAGFVLLLAAAMIVLGIRPRTATAAA